MKHKYANDFVACFFSLSVFCFYFDYYRWHLFRVLLVFEPKYCFVYHDAKYYFNCVLNNWDYCYWIENIHLLPVRISKPFKLRCTLVKILYGNETTTTSKHQSSSSRARLTQNHVSSSNFTVRPSSISYGFCWCTQCRNCHYTWIEYSR